VEEGDIAFDPPEMPLAGAVQIAVAAPGGAA
jgi:hypothetical protein